MLSKNKTKELSRYSQKKYRDEDNVFIAEGHKTVEELLPFFKCKTLVATTDWLQNKKLACPEIIEANDAELQKISLQKSPQQVFAVFEKPQISFGLNTLKNQLILALDDVQDPGNMGTIIRIADWFGIEYVLCSKHCADAFNPKTIQATMGAIARVKVIQTDLEKTLNSLSGKMPIFGTFLNGENIYQEQLPPNGIIVMGNEGNGISQSIEPLVNKRLYIPSYPAERETSESLNVATATAIVCAEFRRRLN